MLKRPLARTVAHNRDVELWTMPDVSSAFPVTKVANRESYPDTSESRGSKSSGKTQNTLSTYHRNCLRVVEYGTTILARRLNLLGSSLLDLNPSSVHRLTAKQLTETTTP